MSEGAPSHEGNANVDRQALADRLLSARTLLLARIRQRLVRAGLTSTQAEDIFSTTLRRTDAAAVAGRIVSGIDDDQLIALATAISKNAVREQARRERRDRERCEGAAGHAPQAADGPILHDDADDPFLRLTDAEAMVVQLRLRGAGWSLIGEQLGMSASAAHRRYYRALQRLGEGA